MKYIVGLTAICAAVCLTAACSLWPAQPPLAQVHDFGPLPAVDHNEGSSVRVDAVTAPTWLSSDSIHYRLLYDDPTALRQYADNRWAAPPAELLTARLQYLLSQGPARDRSVQGNYTISATLLEFEQDFSTPHDAEARLVLEVFLRRSNDNQIVAQREFIMTQSVKPEVQGAFEGLSQLSNQITAAIAGWTRSQTQE